MDTYELPRNCFLVFQMHLDARWAETRPAIEVGVNVEGNRRTVCSTQSDAYPDKLGFMLNLDAGQAQLEITVDGESPKRWSMEKTNSAGGGTNALVREVFFSLIDKNNVDTGAKVWIWWYPQSA